VAAPLGLLHVAHLDTHSDGPALIQVSHAVTAHSKSNHLLSAVTLIIS